MTIKELINFLQSQNIDDWTVSYLLFDDVDGLCINLYTNEKKIPNKTSYITGGHAWEWDSMFIRTNAYFEDIKKDISHENDCELSEL